MIGAKQSAARDVGMAQAGISLAPADVDAHQDEHGGEEWN